MEALLRDLCALATLVAWVVQDLEKKVIDAAANAERQHHRAQLLAAYRCRNSWKKSDIQHLQTLHVSVVAQSRMKRLAGRGRPVVRPYQPLWSIVASRYSALEPLVNLASSPHQRRGTLKRWPWWSHYVEALYRGEHALAKAKRIRGPSHYAEDAVADALAISAATVHSICGGIRRLRKECTEAANFPAMTLSDFETWMETGDDSFRIEHLRH